MKVEMLMSNTPTNAGAIANLAEEIGLVFSDEYSQFLLAQNGGAPVNELFSYGDGKRSAVSFLGVDTGEYYSDLSSKYEVFRARIPGGFLPIGQDPGGNLICLDLGGDKGVYFWDHEKEQDPPTRENVAKIAGSFNEFLSTLEPDVDGEDW